MSLPRVAFGWRPPRPPSGKGLDAFGRLKRNGNMGYCVISEAAERIIACDRAASVWMDIRALAEQEPPHATAEHLASRFDALVLPMAYDIGAAGLAPVARLLECLTIPVVTLCVGIACAPDTPLSELPEGNKAFLDVLNRKAALFGVRGEVTRLWLHAHGYDRAAALGCPSLHLRPPPFAAISPDWNAMRVQTGGYLLRDARRGEALSRLLADCRATYVLQDEWLNAPQLGAVEAAPESYAFDPARVAALCEMRHGFRPAFAAYELHLSVDAWRAASQARDIFIGDRLHGAAVGIQAGQAALLFDQDVRARELADFYALPVTDLMASADAGLAATLGRFAQPGLAMLRHETWERRDALLRGALKKIGLPMVDL